MMGILITQREEEWIVELREEWFFTERKELNECIDYLLNIKIPFSVCHETVLNCQRLTLNAVKVNAEDHETTMAIVKRIVDYKAKYGQRQKLEKIRRTEGTDEVPRPTD